MIESGKYRHYISIQNPTETRDTHGEPIITWPSTYHKAWASIEPLQGWEYWESKRINAEVSSKIEMRYKSGINPKMRVVWGDHTYRILSVINESERNNRLTLMVEETITT